MWAYFVCSYEFIQYIKPPRTGVSKVRRRVNSEPSSKSCRSCSKLWSSVLISEIRTPDNLDRWLVNDQYFSADRLRTIHQWIVHSTVSIHSALFHYITINPGLA